MTLKLGLGMVLLALVVCGGCGGETTAPSDSPSNANLTMLNNANFSALVRQGSGAAMVEFFRPTCPHCQSMEPIVAQLARDYATRALVGKVDTTTDIELANSFGVTGVPTFVFFKNGREVSRKVGTETYTRLASMLDEAIAVP